MFVNQVNSYSLDSQKGMRNLVSIQIVILHVKTELWKHCNYQCNKSPWANNYIQRLNITVSCSVKIQAINFRDEQSDRVAKHPRSVASPNSDLMVKEINLPSISIPIGEDQVKLVGETRFTGTLIFLVDWKLAFDFGIIALPT